MKKSLIAILGAAALSCSTPYRLDSASSKNEGEMPKEPKIEGYTLILENKPETNYFVRIEKFEEIEKNDYSLFAHGKTDSGYRVKLIFTHRKPRNEKTPYERLSEFTNSIDTNKYYRIPSSELDFTLDKEGAKSFKPPVIQYRIDLKK